MQHFDLSPLYRASIGFDQVSDLMNRVISTNSTTTSYPPYDIEKQRMIYIGFLLQLLDFQMQI